MELFDAFNNSGGFSPVLISIEVWCIAISLVMTFIVITMKVRDARRERQAMSDIRITTNLSSRRSTLLLCILITIIIMQINDVMAMSYIGSSSDLTYYVAHISNYILFASEYVYAWIFFRYLIKCIETSGMIVKYFWRTISDIILLLSVAMLTISQPTDLFYWFDSMNAYHRSELFWLSYVGGILFISIFFACLVRYRKAFSQKRKIVFLSFMICPIVALFIRYLFFDVSLLVVAYFVTTFIAFFEFSFSRARWLRPVWQPIANLREKEVLPDIRIKKSSTRNIKHIFIVNPIAGGYKYAKDLRQRLSKVKDLEYFVFVSRKEYKEHDIMERVQKFFQGERIRVYCCGGSGTARNIINGIRDFENVEVAYYPCGMTNDFLKSFGEGQDRFTDIEALINGTVMKIDYLKTKDGIALNTISTGMDSYFLQEKFKVFNVFGGRVPYFVGAFVTMFTKTPDEYEVDVDGRVIRGAFSEILIGNGNTIAGFLRYCDKANISDGKLNYMIEGNRWGLGHIKPMQVAITNDDEGRQQYFKVGECKRMIVRRLDDKPFEMVYDGEFDGEMKEWQIDVVKQGLNFVVPDGVEVYEG